MGIFTKLTGEDPPPEPPSERTDAARVARTIVEIVSSIPTTTELACADPPTRARDLQLKAAMKAAAVSGAMTLPPGPWGMALMIPDLLAVWRIQAQLIADTAGVFGKSAELRREEMFYCLFRHGAAHVCRDLLVDRVGERVLLRRATVGLLQAVAGKVGMRLAKRLLAQSVARWLPLVGSAGVAAYAYYDTIQIGRTARALFGPVSPDR
jgi:hypothetical protein